LAAPATPQWYPKGCRPADSGLAVSENRAACRDGADMRGTADERAASRRSAIRAIVHRLLFPALFALGLAGVIETAIEVVFRPGFWQRTTWLMHDPYKGEPFDRIVLYEKLSHFENSDPEIISVGDSSGFFGLQSRIVNRYLDGHRYLSLNTGANQAYAGYQGIAEYMLQRSPHLRYVVIYAYPQLQPAQGLFKDADLAPILHDDLVGMKAALTPPSAAFSPYAKFKIFDNIRFDPDAPMANHVPGLLLRSTIDEALGWLPEFDVRFDRIDGRGTFFPDRRPEWYQRLGLSDPSTINATLDGFARMVRSYGAQLVMAYAPAGARAVEIGDPNVVADEQALARFQRENPDVKFLFPLITRWGTEKIGTLNHVSREYTFLSSARMGRALARLIKDPRSIAAFETSYRDPGSYPAIATKALGPPDPALLNPALALYLYASTADENYRGQIAARSLALLEREDAFQYMMADARERAASLAERGIKIGFDLSQLRATPMAVTGLPFCADGAGLQWVQIDGTMIFTYQSKESVASSPVAWPATSHILIPLATEDGVRKFDGYCPETMSY
jgi:hypothetical protein